MPQTFTYTVIDPGGRNLGSFDVEFKRPRGKRVTETWTVVSATGLSLGLREAVLFQQGSLETEGFNGFMFGLQLRLNHKSTTGFNELRIHSNGFPVLVS